MAWALVNKTIATYTNTTTPTLTITQPLANTLMLCAIAARDNANAVDPAVTSFTGWTQVPNAAVSLSSGADASCFLYYRLAPGGFGTTIDTLTLDRACNGVLAYACFSGNHTVFTNVTSAAAEETTPAASLAVGPVTPVVGNELVVYVVYGHNGWGGTDPYVSWSAGTRLNDQTNGGFAGLGWAFQVALNTDAKTSTASWSGTRQALEIAAIFDAAAVIASTQVATLGLDGQIRMLLGDTTGVPSVAPGTGAGGSLSLDLRITV